MSRWNNKNCGFQKGHTTNKGKKLTKEHKEKVRQANLGKVLSQKTRKKVSSSLMGNKRGRGNKGRTGDRASNWKGGLTSKNELIRASKEYKLWRIAIYERDSWTCIWCGYRSKKKGDIHADHIKPLSLFPELRFAIDNGRTLCVNCHKKTYSYLNNKMDIKVYQEAV